MKTKNVLKAEAAMENNGLHFPLTPKNFKVMKGLIGKLMVARRTVLAYYGPPGPYRELYIEPGELVMVTGVETTARSKDFGPIKSELTFIYVNDGTFWCRGFYTVDISDQLALVPM